MTRQLWFAELFSLVSYAILPLCANQIKNIFVCSICTVSVVCTFYGLDDNLEIRGRIWMMACICHPTLERKKQKDPEF